MSMSVMRRSFSPPLIDPPSSSSIAPSTRLVSAASSIRVSIGCTSKIADSELGGTCVWALAHVSWVLVSSSSSSGTRSSADRRVDAVRQNASSVRRSRRSCSAVNFVGRVKSTARIRRRRWGADDSSGRRPSRAASTSAAIASGLRTCPLTGNHRRSREGAIAGCYQHGFAHAHAGTREGLTRLASLPPASRTVTRMSSRCTRIVRPRLPPVSVAMMGIRR